MSEIESLPSSSSSPAPSKKSGIANALTGFGKNVLRFRISGNSPRCQVAAYFWKPDNTDDADSADPEFDVSIFSGSYLPDDLTKLDRVTISHKELSSGIWLIWAIDCTQDFNIFLKPSNRESRYYFNALLLDPSSTETDDHPDNYLIGKSAVPPSGACGGMYVGPWDQDYHVPNSPSSPDGSPRLVAYNLNSGKSTRVHRKHFDGASKHPRALDKLPAWLDHDPAGITLDELELNRVMEVFRHFDRDNNRTIDRHEMSRVAKHVYEILKEQPVTPEQIDLLFEKYDTNRDKSLSLAEFQKIFLSIKKEMIREGLLPAYHKHFQWRINHSVHNVPSIKRTAQTPEPSEDDFFAQQQQQQAYGYQPADASVYQFFNPAFYQNAAYDPQQQQQQQNAYAQMAAYNPFDFGDSSSDDSSSDDDDFFFPPHHDPLAHFKVPLPAGMPYKLMFPELPALHDLIAVKAHLPHDDYLQVQAGFLRFLKIRLGYSDALPYQFTHPTPAPFFPAPHPAPSYVDPALAAGHYGHHYGHHHHPHQYPHVYSATPYAQPQLQQAQYQQQPQQAQSYYGYPQQGSAGHEHTYGPNCAWTLQYNQIKNQANAASQSAADEHQHEHDPEHGDQHHHDHSESTHVHHHDDHPHHDGHPHHHEHSAEHGNVHHHDHSSSQPHVHHHDNHEHHSSSTSPTSN